LDRVATQDETGEPELTRDRIRVRARVVGHADAHVSVVDHDAAQEVMRAADLEGRAAKEATLVVVLEPGERARDVGLRGRPTATWTAVAGGVTREAHAADVERDAGVRGEGARRV